MESKDGSKTFSADGIFYHSSYSPLKEAQRFVETSEFLYTPKIIFIFEPGFSYCTAFFKKRFPECKLVCIRLFEHIFEDEKNWDLVFRYNNELSFSQNLLLNFGEEALLCSTVVIWKPAEKLFESQLNSFLNNYKTTLENCKTLLVTRQFFEKKWLLNSLNFITNIRNVIQPQIKTELPIVVCASGPSLKLCIKTIKDNKDKLFIICLSSALSVFNKNNITPDLVLSTDGGYWAGEHLKSLKKKTDIPLAVSCEAFVPKQILQNNPVLPLYYNDESSYISSTILEEAKLEGFEALRNPTVSGTALFLAKAITENKIYFCGLDLASSSGFQHTQPNELEKNNTVKDFRINNAETRISRSRYNSDSLKVYRDWFSSLGESQVKNVFRVIDKNIQEPLGNIKDISPAFFMSDIQNCSSSKSFTFITKPYENTNLKNIYKQIIQNLKTEKWSHQIFPADYISMQNCTVEKERLVLQQRLDSKIEKLIQKIKRLSDD